MKILAVGAHPDDIEVCCFGTLAKFAKEENNEIFIAVSCRGNAGTKELSGEEISKIRFEEAKKAADLISAEYVNLGFGDGQIFFNQESLTVFIDLMRGIEPDVIITHSPVEKDLHNDHFYTHQLVLSSSIWATHHNLEMETKYHPIDKTAAIFYFEQFPYGFEGFPTHYVDISSVFEIKRKAMFLHRSQIQFTKKLTGVDMLEEIEIVAKKRGMECGVKYAEAFQELTKYPHVKPERFLP